MSEATATAAAGTGVAPNATPGVPSAAPATIKVDGAGGAGNAMGGSSGGTGASAHADWTTGLTPEVKGFVQNKGFKDPAQVLDSYQNLEKLLGAPQERVVRLPEKADDPAWNEIYGRLGRPKEAKEYDLKVPEGGSPEFADWAKKTFHGLGLQKVQGEKLVEAWNAYQAQTVQAQSAAYEASVAKAEGGLKKEWGMAYDQNVKIAAHAAKVFGIDGDTMDKMESALGFAPLVKLMHTIGSKLGEHNFVGSGSSSSKGFTGGVMTPDAALARIRSLQSDPSFTKKYLAGEVDAKEEMHRLHQMAYPEAAS